MLTKTDTNPYSLEIRRSTQGTAKGFNARSFGLFLCTLRGVFGCWVCQIRLLKRQALEAKEDMEEMRRTHKDNANVSMQLLKKVRTTI